MLFVWVQQLAVLQCAPGESIMAMPANGVFPGHMQPYPAVWQHLGMAHVLPCMTASWQSDILGSTDVKLLHTCTDAA